MIKIGITGGIGSGKSLVCEVFSALGIPVYNADARAKNLMNTNPQIREALEERFGKDIYQNNQLDRAKMAAIIFADKPSLEFVNGIVHPAVGRDFDEWSQLQEPAPYVVEEAALLFESGSYKQMDKMLTVYAPENIRIRRVVSRDAATPEQIKSRMQNQLSEEEKIKRSDEIIFNDEQNSVLEQVLRLHNKIITQAIRGKE